MRCMLIERDHMIEQVSSHTERRRARALVRQIFEIAADLIPDYAANTLTVRLHHFTQAAHDQAIEKLLVELNATQTIFPGTRLRLIFKIGSS